MRIHITYTGGTISRKKGLQPVIDYRNPPELRLVHLLALLREIPRKERS